MKKRTIQDALRKGKVEWSAHAFRGMLERGISRMSVLHVIAKGEVIEDYPKDKPFPSLLLLGYWDQRPLHVVIAYDEKNPMVSIITAYVPDLEHFEPDWKTRRRS